MAGMDSNSNLWIKIQADVAGVGPKLNTIESGLDAIAQKADSVSKHTASMFDKIATDKVQKLKGIFSSFSADDTATFSKAGANIQSGLGTAMRVIVAGATAATTAVGGLTTAALSLGGNFEEQMTLVKGVANGTEADFDSLTQKARELGKALPVTASQVAGAMYSIASAGLDTKQILDSIGGIVNLSIAQKFDLPSASDTVISTMRGFNMEADQTNRIVDVFNTAINSSQLTMNKLAFAMRYVAPISSGLGISFEQTTAALAALSDRGLKGEAIGTGLRAVMLALVKPTKEAAEVLDRLGVSAYDTATGKLKPLVDIFSQLKTGGMSMKDAATIFGTEGSTPATILMSATDAMQKYEAQLGKTGGTQALVNQQMQTFPNKVAAVKSAIEESLLIVFDGIKVKSKSVTDELLTQIDSFNVWAQKSGALGNVMASFFEGLGIDVSKVGNMSEALKSIDLDSLNEKFRETGAGVGALVDSLKELYDLVPWSGIAKHFSTIIEVVVGSWLLGKAAGFVASIGTIISAFTRLREIALVPLLDLLSSSSGMAAGGPWVAGLMAVALELGAIVNSYIALKKAKKETENAKDGADRLEQIQKDYTAAVAGSVEALGRLPEKYREMAQATLDARNKAKELAAENKKLAETPISQTYNSMKSAAKAAYDAGKSTAGMVEASTAAISDGMKKFVGEDKIRQLVSGWEKDFREAGAKSGKAAGDAILDGMKSSLLSRKLNIVTDAIKAGLLKGDALKEAGNLVGTFVNKINVASGKETSSEFAGLNLSAALLSKLQESEQKKVLATSGIQKAGDNKISVQIGNVTVKNVDEAKKAGENIGAGIRASFSPGY